MLSFIPFVATLQTRVGNPWGRQIIIIIMGVFGGMFQYTWRTPQMSFHGI